MANNFQLLFDLGDVTVDLLCGIATQEHSVCIKHCHQHIEFHFIYAGTQEIEFENETIFLNAGDVCMIPKQVHHQIKSASPDLERCAFMLHFKHNKNISTAIYKKWVTLFGMDSFRVISMNNLKNFFSDIQACPEPLSVESRLKLNAIFSLMLLETADKLQKAEKHSSALSPDGDRTDERLFKMEYYIESHYMEDITVSSLAEYMHLCERQVNRILKKYTLLSFRELLMQQRMWIAKGLLENSDIRVIDIPAMVGFSSYSGFYYSVRKFWGFPPDEIRKRRIPPHNNIF